MLCTGLLPVNESHDVVHAFGFEPCRLFQLALHAVFYSIFLSVFTAMYMHIGLLYVSMPAHAQGTVSF